MTRKEKINEVLEEKGFTYDDFAKDYYKEILIERNGYGIHDTYGKIVVRVSESLYFKYSFEVDNQLIEETKFIIDFVQQVIEENDKLDDELNRIAWGFERV